MNYDLVTTLALTVNTKVVHNNPLNMFKLLIRSHNHFIHGLPIKLSRSTCIASLKYLIRQNDLREHCFTSHHKCSKDAPILPDLPIPNCDCGRPVDVFQSRHPNTVARCFYTCSRFNVSNCFRIFFSFHLYY